MVKQTFSVGNLTFEQAAAVNGFLSGGAAAAPAAPAAAAPLAPPVPAAPAAAPAPPMPGLAPAAPAAAPGARTVLMALSELTAKKGAAVGKALVQKYTGTYPDGDPKKNSAKFADIHPAHAEPFIAEADAMAAG